MQLRSVRDHRRRAPERAGRRTVLDAVSEASYEGIELGPPGYLGDRHHAPRATRKPPVGARRRLHPDPLQRAGRPRRRLARNGVDARFLRGRRRARGKAGLRRRRLAGARRASRRCATTARSGSTTPGWRRFADGVARAASRPARAASSPPSTTTPPPTSKRPGRSSGCSS